MMLFDSTLRDGSHAVNQQLSLKNVEEYCEAVDSVGMYTVIVGHGNGLGASSLQVGLSLLSDEKMLTAAKKKLIRTKLGAFLLPGFGTIEDDLQPAFGYGVDLVCVASHCTEADITREHIEYAAKQGKEAYGILMLQHTVSDSQILEQAKKMESYGARGVVLMDSAGASLPSAVGKRIDYLSNRLRIPVGFHAHNNLSLAVANSIAAVEAGAQIIDGTTRGFGAGAGNCQLEVLIAVLEKMGYGTDIDLYQLMDISDNIVSQMVNTAQGISGTNLISGIAGVFSSYAPHVLKTAKEFQVDPREIFMEMGRRKTVGGQEDIIVEVAAGLCKKV